MYFATSIRDRNRSKKKHDKEAKWHKENADGKALCGSWGKKIAATDGAVTCDKCLALMGGFGK